MNKISVNNLTKLAAQLPQNAEISKNEQMFIKGGCGGSRTRRSSCSGSYTSGGGCGSSTPTTPTPPPTTLPPIDENGNLG